MEFSVILLINKHLHSFHQMLRKSVMPRAIGSKNFTVMFPLVSLVSTCTPTYPSSAHAYTDLFTISQVCILTCSIVLDRIQYLWKPGISMTQLSAALFLHHKLIQLSCATTSKFYYALANLVVHGRLCIIKHLMVVLS